MKNSFQILVLAVVSTLVLFSCSNGRTDLKNQACKHETGVGALIGVVGSIATGVVAPASAIVRPLHGSKSDYRLLSIW